jgi:addiction module HigA family antidote
MQSPVGLTTYGVFVFLGEMNDTWRAMIQRNPPHLGSLLREDVLPALGLTVSEAAEQLGASRATLSRVINEHAAISPEMAARLEQWTTGPSALGRL